MGGQRLNAAGRQSATIAGAGLAGALLALLLARRGLSVDVFERRSDPRLAGYAGGRSINLALAERGMHALRLAGLHEPVLAQAVMMRGRMVHEAGGNVALQRYGRDDSEVIWSINRGRLNLTLLDAAERAGARLHFDQRLAAVNFERHVASFVDDRDGSTGTHEFGVILGADGAGSALRQAMNAVSPLGERFEPLGHGYKELEIPPLAEAIGAGGSRFALEPHALHIWPRGGYMCIALPNAEASFTVTLFLPNEGDPSFATIATPQQARAFFQREFPDALPLIPELETDFASNPTGVLGTLRLERWRLDGRAVLLGDAAHAMVPFHGQGMNCAFEDCVAMDRIVAQGGDWAETFAAFESERRPNAIAIQDMALENYIEMRDRVDDADYLLQKQLERVLAERHPGIFLPRYGMVTFTRTPYALAQSRGALQAAILQHATRGLARLDQVDLAQADAAVRAGLAPLPANA